MAKGGQKDHSGMNKETYDRHYAANKYQGGHHGVEGSPAQQVGAIDPLTGLPAQQMTNMPPAPSNTLGQAQPVFNQQTQQNAQGMFGTQQPGSYDRVMPMSPLGKKGPIKEGLKALAYAAAGGLAPIVQVAESLLKNKTSTSSSTQKVDNENSSVKSLTAQKKYNDQLRKKQASKKTYTKTSRKIEKVPRKKVEAVSTVKPASIQISATEPTAFVKIKNK